MKDKQLQVLAVDDDLNVLSLIKFTLEMSTNWQVHTVSSGHEGLTQARATRPDLILSDLIMPRMDGMEMIGFLRSEGMTQQIPVFVLTSEPQLISPQQQQQLGIKKVIAKPFDSLSLAEQIVTALSSNT